LNHVQIVVDLVGFGILLDVLNDLHVNRAVAIQKVDVFELLVHNYQNVSEFLKARKRVLNQIPHQHSMIVVVDN
jgi:hypothetical protein